MLNELTLMKWQEKATKMAAEDATSHVVELQENVSKLEENLTNERFFLLVLCFFSTLTA